MNLTIVDIVKAHGERVTDACSAAHERLMSMDQNRIVMDEQSFVDSIVNDEEVDIPISVVEEDITVGDITAAIAERISEAEENLAMVQDGRTYTDEEWFLLSCWKIELARRGETNPVTMGARPIALRTLALLQAERKLQDIPDHEVSMKPRPKWADALRNIRDEAEMAQTFIAEVVPNITQTSMKGDSTMHQFVTPEAVEGHPRDVMLEFAPGQIIAVLTIILSYNDDTQEADVAVIEVAMEKVDSGDLDGYEEVTADLDADPSEQVGDGAVGDGLDAGSEGQPAHSESTVGQTVGLETEHHWPLIDLRGVRVVPTRASDDGEATGIDGQLHIAKRPGQKDFTGRPEGRVHRTGKTSNHDFYRQDDLERGRAV